LPKIVFFLNAPGGTSFSNSASRTYGS
jgi:hypothetical protein